MVKNFLVTYGLDNSLWAIQSGQYDNVRLMSGTSEVQGIEPPVPPTHPWRRVKDAAQLPQQDADSWFQFSAACYHFAEAVTDQHVLAKRPAPTLGLVSTAIGGSAIEECAAPRVASRRVATKRMPGRREALPLRQLTPCLASLPRPRRDAQQGDHGRGGTGVLWLPAQREWQVRCASACRHHRRQ